MCSRTRKISLDAGIQVSAGILRVAELDARRQAESGSQGLMLVAGLDAGRQG
jgi:hypothetical protein